MLVAWWGREERATLLQEVTVKALKLATYTTLTPVAIAILDHC